MFHTELQSRVSSGHDGGETLLVFLMVFDMIFEAFVEVFLVIVYVVHFLVVHILNGKAYAGFAENGVNTVRLLDTFELG